MESIIVTKSFPIQVASLQHQRYQDVVVNAYVDCDPLKIVVNAGTVWYETIAGGITFQRSNGRSPYTRINLAYEKGTTAEDLERILEENLPALREKLNKEYGVVF